MTPRRATTFGSPVLVALVVLAASLSGCSLIGSDDPAPATTTTAPTTTTTAPPVARSEPPELLDPGEAPRQALRVAYAEGDEAVVTFTSDLAITQESDGRTQRLDSPPIRQTLAYTVGPVTDDGAALTIRIDAIAAAGKGTGLTDEELTALDDELAPLVGLEATATATPLGELEGLTFDVPAALDDDLAAQLDVLASQLPALGPALPTEPVGVGASWRTTSSTNAGGAELQTVSTITVTSLDDSVLGYTSTIRTTAEPQDLALAGLDDGTTARLLSSDVAGTATGSLGLDHVAITLRTRLRGAQQIELRADGATTALDQALDVAYAATTDAG